MDRDELIAVWREGGRIALPYFDGAKVELFFEEEDHLTEVADAILAFLTLSPEDRLRNTRHAYAYFRDFTDEVGFDRVEDGMVELTEESGRVWDFVYPTTLSAEHSWEIGNRDALRTYVNLEANCGWEAEHGLQMSWRDGLELVKLSAYDGHSTNGHAFGDLTKDRFIYAAMAPRWSTENHAFTANSGGRFGSAGLWARIFRRKQH